MCRIFAYVCAVLVFAAPCYGQIQPGGTFTPGHAIAAGNTAGTFARDAGGAAGSGIFGFGYLTEIGITNTGTPFCINDALTTAQGGYHQLCLGANALSRGLLSYNAYGGASALPLSFNINGTTYDFPITLSGILGPNSSTIGYVPVWNNTAGSLLAQPSAGSASNLPGSLAVGAAVPRTANWLETLIPGSTSISQLPVISSSGQGFGILGAARASDFAGNTNDSIGASGIGVCDTTIASSGKVCWGGYFEVRRTAASTDQFTEGVEIDEVSLATLAKLNPLAYLPAGGTPALTIDCGRPDVVSPQPCSAAINIVPNGARFDVGFNFAYNSLSLAEGSGGLGVAMQLAAGQSILWLDSATGVPRGEIYASNGGIITLAGVVNSLGYQFAGVNLLTVAGGFTQLDDNAGAGALFLNASVVTAQRLINTTVGYQMSGVNLLTVAGGFTQLDDPGGTGALLIGTSGAADRLTILGLPAAGGAGGVNACVDAAGHVYAKTPC